jgi:DNA-binding CsgD family transcriptional regulator
VRSGPAPGRTLDHVSPSQAASWSAERTLRELIRLTHRQLDTATLYRESSEVLGRFVPFDAACGHTMDPATLLLTRQFSDQFDADGFALVCRNEYLQADVNKFLSLLDRPSPVGTLTDATEGHPDRSARYREILQPFGFGPELRATFTAGGACWASLVVLRRAEQPEFDPEEAAFVASVGPYLGHAVRSSLLLAAVAEEGSGTSNAIGADASPGLVLLNARGEPEAINQPAERWLAELAGPASTVGAAGIPGPIYVVAAAARRAATGDDGMPAEPAYLRVQTQAGRWLILHGSVLDDGPRARTSVIIEVARPAEIAPLIVQAYGLTGREREVTQLVLQGRSTEDIARRLFLSAYTVQDHLKAIFDKVGVRSRKALVARVFFDQYQPRERAGAPLSPDGWYVAETPPH